MRDAERARLVADLVELVAFVAAESSGTVVRLAEWSGRGLVVSGSQAGFSGHRGASPVESASLRPDPFGVWARMFDRDLKTARDALKSARATILRATPVPQADTDTDGCVSCRRVGTWSPVTGRARLERGRPRKDAIAVPLCSWCAGFFHAEKRLPAKSLLEKHLRGGRVTQQDIDRANRAS